MNTNTATTTAESKANRANTKKPPVVTAKANRGKRRIIFQIEAEPGSNVFVAGDFNDWSHTAHPLSDEGHPGEFRRYIFVEPGRYEYKFSINGQWHIDPNCTAWAPNKFGSLNSVVTTP